MPKKTSPKKSNTKQIEEPVVEIIQENIITEESLVLKEEEIETIEFEEEKQPLEPENTKDTSTFPLYNLLIEQTKDEPLTQNDLIDFIENFRKLDKYGMDLIFVIIRIFSLKNNKQSNNLFDIPFGGQKLDTIDSSVSNKTDVKFDIRNFPNKLNQMLYHFVKLHLTSKQTM